MKIYAPMLAPSKSLDLESFSGYPVYVSPKYDGIRCLIIDGKAVSRTLKPIPNVYIRETLEKLKLPNGLDGELVTYSEQILDYMPRIDKYNDLQGKVMSFGGTPLFQYHVFDWIMDKPFKERYETLWNSSLDTINNIKVVLQIYCNNLEQLIEAEEQYLVEGFEGAIIKSPNSYYKQGRCTDREGIMWKLKRFEDSEAIVMGMECAYENTNEAEEDNFGRTKRSKRLEGMIAKEEMGRLIVKDINHPEWPEFGIGTGFTQADRIWWYNYPGAFNLIVKYKYQKHGFKDVPRIPVYQGIRNKIDL